MHVHHGHGASHGRGHGTAVDRPATRRRMAWVLALAASYMVAEIVGGLWTGSLALLADAGHMASDVAALGLAWFALRVAERPADARRTYGHARVEILAALAQGAGLVLVAVFVAFEAIERLADPRAVAAPGMMAVAAGGLAVNLFALWILADGRRQNMNVRGAWLHVLSDALGSVGALTAGAAIWLRGWTWADPVASLAICGLILASAWHLLRDAVEVLMEAAPRHLDVEEIRAGLAESPDVLDVHDLHVWTIGSGEVALSSHVVSARGSEPAALLRELRDRLKTRFGIDHSTLQIEPVSDDASAPGACDAACDVPARAAGR